MNTRPAFLFLLAVSFLNAHPMGNFSVSHYARFTPSGRGLSITYALDLAEIPSFELLREWNLERASPRDQLDAKALQQAREWIANLHLTIDGQPLRPMVHSAQLHIADGAGSLPVLRITAKAFAPTQPGLLRYEDRNYPDRAGWKEIVIDGDGRPARDLSHALTAYPEDPTIAPPQDTTAQFAWHPRPRPVLPTAAPAPKTEEPRIVLTQIQNPPPPPGTLQRGDTLSQLLGKQELGISAMLLALALAFGFGAMHAMSPGHGKTIVAAYLVGSRGTFKHALFLGAMVTFTHTVSVFLLGLGTLFLSRYIVPDKIYPILSALSGAMIVAIGAMLFYKRLHILADHSHSDHHHVVGHHHHDHGHDHDHGPGTHTHVPEGEVTFSSLTGLAVSGGLVPCPSALVLLLSAIALGRIGFGLALLTSFSLGLALVLITIGGIVLFAKNLLPDTPKVTTSPLFRMLPVFSAAAITVIGLIMTAAALGWIKLNVA